jgi:hypothetical protein
MIICDQQIDFHNASQSWLDRPRAANAGAAR